MADHLSQSNTKSAIEHEARPAEECTVVFGRSTLFCSPWVDSCFGMEDLIWNLEGDLEAEIYQRHISPTRLKACAYVPTVDALF